ncbi:MAG: hypothetical protein UW30_C0005G0008 [Candidatus Giovannonibacteria bacterium GW2011_GWA2_44_13b]|uniref:Bifunctional protein GlmU n=2 Tax=Candidatus Giovannoniibacteriota TaxID=1752738 RepID=A0A0G1K1N7_9BACT|nr:MAG: hypothetical protein UW30_C0005G0008 [Candidatus Giovannonibacteria bacterium GW2011_GWA2_44_13b]OGF81336.1 MAG: hypothetical protein A2924_04730 [Candidatus Giovannonibacteria bacterium RIFCSPLOWO2_01_FULL_44_16]
MRRCSSYHNNSWSKLHELGVKFPYPENPDRYNIDTSVRFSEGVIVWPDVILDGDIVIGKNSEIGRGAKIIGKIHIGDNVKIKDYVKITGEGYIGDNSEIGHDIHNPKIGKNCVIEGNVIESEIGDNCEIGKFAEIKRSKLALGVNAKHACGIRDADVGPLTNVASGTDIKNYDGVEKYRTVIGEKCFVAGEINGGIKIGDEVRIHPKAFVKENLPSMSYYAYDKIKEYRSWYLEGYYLNLDLPILYLNRLHFIWAVEKKLGYKFSDGKKPIEENLKKYLNTPNGHLNLTPLRALEKLGCAGILCILGECDHFGKSQKKQESTP